MYIPISLMMIIFTPTFGQGFFERACTIKPEYVERVFIRARGDMHDVYINEEKFTCLCGKPGESVHIFADEVLVCCKEHRPTIK